MVFQMFAFPELRPPTLWPWDGESMGMWLAAQATVTSTREGSLGQLTAESCTTGQVGWGLQRAQSHGTIQVGSDSPELV